MTSNPGLRCSGISGGLDPAYTVRNAAGCGSVSLFRTSAGFPDGRGFFTSREVGLARPSVFHYDRRAILWDVKVNCPTRASPAPQCAPDIPWQEFSPRSGEPQ